MGAHLRGADRRPLACWGDNNYGQLNGYRVTLPLVSRAY